MGFSQRPNNNMKHLLTLLLAALCAATSYAQTIKTLGFNTTNGQVVANTGTNVLTFTNNVTFGYASMNSATISGLYIVNGIFMYDGDDQFEFNSNGTTFILPINFDSSNVSATTRTNLGLGLPALTNTSNVTMMRSLAGSTNTNEPFSGVLTVLDVGAFDDTVVVTISNGIIISIVP